MAADLVQHLFYSSCCFLLRSCAIQSASDYFTITKPVSPRDTLQFGCIWEAEGQQVEFQPYEFNSSQNQLIQGLSQKMRFVGYFLIALGALLILTGIVVGGLGTIIQGIIQIIIGIWTAKAATSFQLIVKTQGNDIENLMKALGELRKLYTLQYWAFIIALIVVTIGIIAALILRPSVG